MIHLIFISFLIICTLDSSTVRAKNELLKVINPKSLLRQIQTIPDSDTRENVTGLSQDYCLAYEASDYYGMYNSLSKLGSIYISINNFDYSEKIFESCVEVGKNIPELTYLAGAYNNLASVMLYKSKFDSSIINFKNALTVYEQLNEEISYASALINISKVYRKTAEYEKALDYLYEAIAILETKEDQKKILSSCYTSLAIVNKYLSNFDESIKFHEKALSIREDLQNHKLVSESLHNLGNSYYNKEEFNTALTYYFKALNYNARLSDSLSKAKTFHSIGMAYLKQDSLIKAEKYLNESIKINKSINLNASILPSLTTYGRLNLQLGNLEKADNVLEELFRLLDIYNDPVIRSNVLKLAKEVYEKKGKHQEALKYMNEYMSLHDSLFDANKNQELTELQFKYESEQKESQIRFLKETELILAKDIFRQKVLIIVLVLASILLLVTVVLFYNRYQIKKRSNDRILFLMRELHHRVKNNFQLVSSLLSLQSQRLEDPIAKEAVKRGEDRVKAMSLIHQNLYLDEEISEIDMNRYIRNLIKNLIFTNGFNESKIKIDGKIDNIKLNVDKAIPLGLIINELLSNAFKHAFINHPNPELLVDFNYQQGRLNLSVGDNGNQNFNVELNKSGSFGLRMVNTLVKQLQAKMETKYINGLKYKLIMEI